MELVVCYRDKQNEDRVVMLDVGYSEADIARLLEEHPSWYRSILVEDIS